MRARYPDIEGFIERDGVKVGYEVFGEGGPAVVFPPIDALVHARAWKAQVPYLARTSTVVTIDPRGNGRSDRPQSLAAYAAAEFVADTIAVMDATGIEQAVLVGLCTSGWRALLTAALHPDRVLGVVSIATVAPFLTPPLRARAVYDFEQVYDTDEGWAKETRDYCCATGAATPSSSSASCCRSRTRPSSTRTASAGPWRRPPKRSCCRTTRRSRSPAAPRPRPSCGRCAARCWRSTARRTVASRWR